jgi:hypothetical protein
MELVRRNPFVLSNEKLVFWLQGWTGQPEKKLSETVFDLKSLGR